MKTIKKIWQWAVTKVTGEKTEGVLSPLDELLRNRSLFKAKFELIRNAFENEHQIYTLSQQAIRNTLVALFDNKEQETTWMNITTSAERLDTLKLKLVIMRDTVIPIDHTYRRFQELQLYGVGMSVEMSFISVEDPTRKITFTLVDTELDKARFDINTPGVMKCDLYFVANIYDSVSEKVEQE